VRRIFQSRADRNAWLALTIAVLGGVALLGERIASSSAGRVLVHDAIAPWIMAVEPFSANLRQRGRSQAPVTRFRAAFRLEEADAGVLMIRAFGAMQVRLNGSPLPVEGGEDRDWKAFQRIEVGRWLSPGRNQLEVDVRNRRGPGLLSLRLVAGDRFIESGPRFKAGVAGRPLEPVRIADDLRRHPEAGGLPSPYEALRSRAWAFAGLIGLWAGVAIGRTRLRAGSGRDAATDAGAAARVAAALLLLAWGILLLRRFIDIPLTQGFDAADHLEYVGFLAREGRIPLASEGWAMYHPPLYYLIVDLLRDAGRLFGAGAERFVTRLPSFAAGLALVWLSGRLAERLHPERAWLRWIAMAFAAALPMNLLLAAHVSNEGLLAAFSAAALVSAVGVLLRDQPERDLGDLAALSVWIGLALLTKITAVVLTATVGVFVGVRLLARTEDRAWLRVRAGVAWLGPAALISGWFYLRNALVYGRPWVGNWNLPGEGQLWWSPPGFHTLDYYTHFGRVLVEPWYAAFASFWDALYSTAWGDGMLGGSASLAGRTAVWDYEWMALGYWTALPISALVLIGLGRWVADCVRDASAQRRAALGLPLVFLAALGFAIGLGTILLPYWGQAKAFYGLSLTPVLAVGFARGYEAADRVVSGRGGKGARELLFVFVAVCLSVLFLGFVG